MVSTPQLRGRFRAIDGLSIGSSSAAMGGTAMSEQEPAAFNAVAFAAWEEPELFAGELRATFRSLR
jgi:hypothetical protein